MVPVSFDGVEGEEGFFGGVSEADVVEDEEFGFRAKVGGVAESGGAEVFFGHAGDISGVAVVLLSGDGIFDRSGDDECWNVCKGIEEGAIGVGDNEHVALIDGFPAADRGAVEAISVDELVFAELTDGNREVLPLAKEVGEADINDFDVMIST